jgi:DNA/RNA endonuclease YhcR with UshA esterase domain
VKKSPGLILLPGLFCAFSLFGVVAQAETLIPDTEAAQHVGQAVAVEGTISRVFKSRNGNIFLNFGGAYPNITFVVWIPQDAPEAADPRLSDLQGKKVKIVGTIQLYRDKPEIKVSTKEQIVAE